MFTCFASLSAMAVNSAVLSLTELPRNGGMPTVTLTCSCPCTHSVARVATFVPFLPKARGFPRNCDCFPRVRHHLVHVSLGTKRCPSWPDHCS